MKYSAFWIVLTLGLAVGAAPPRPSPLGPGVKEFSQRPTLRSSANPKLPVLVYTLPNLTPTQRQTLASLGVNLDADQTKVQVSLTPGVLRALGKLDFVLHIDDLHLIKLESRLARAVVDLAKGEAQRLVAIEVTLAAQSTPAQLESLREFGLDPAQIQLDQLRGYVALGRLARLASLEVVLAISMVILDEPAGEPAPRMEPQAILQSLHQRGIRGQGVRVAILDTAFSPQTSHGNAVATALQALAPAADYQFFTVDNNGGTTVQQALQQAQTADIMTVALGQAIPQAGFLRGGALTVNGLLLVAAGNYNRSLGYSADAARAFTGKAPGSLLTPVLGKEVWFRWPRHQKQTRVFVAWDDGYGPTASRRSDLSLEVREAQSNLLVGFSDDNQLGPRPPREVLHLVRPGVTIPGAVGVTSGAEQFLLRVRTGLATDSLRGRAIRWGVGAEAALIHPSGRVSLNAAPYALAEESVMVGAVDTTGALMAYSGRGPQQDGRIRPNLLAPGQIGKLSGTSAATTYAAGIAALLKSCRPELDSIRLRNLLSQALPQGRLNPAVFASCSPRALSLSP